MSRFRVTIRGEGTEIRGYTTVEGLAALTAPPGEQPYMVIASPAEDDYDPFNGEANAENSLELILGFLAQQEYPNLPDLIRTMANVHYMQANVIQGERALRESAEAELRDRELHHFETEEENTGLLQQLAEAQREVANLIDTINQIKAARSNHPDLPVCEKYPDPEDFVKCGWRSAVEDIDKVLAEVPE